jgi:hypothetical protein
MLIPYFIVCLVFPSNIEKEIDALYHIKLDMLFNYSQL